MRKCKKAYEGRDWRRRGGINRGMKRVNKSIRRREEKKNVLYLTQTTSTSY